MVTAGMTPRDAVRQLEARLTAAGCPDADYDAAELFRLVTGRVWLPKAAYHRFVEQKTAASAE